MRADHAHKLIETGEFETGRSSKKSLEIDAKNLIKGKSVIEKTVEVNMRKATKDADESFKLFDEAYCRLIKKQAEVEKHVRKEVSGFKQRADEVAHALGRINKIAGDGFEEKIKLLERFVEAVSILDDLNQSGRLDKVTNIFNKISN